MYRFSGVGATSDATYYTNRGCTLGEPPADERAQIDRILAVERDIAQGQADCRATAGQGVGACLASVSAGYAPALKAAQDNLTSFCASKSALDRAANTPPPPPAPCPPMPPVTMMPHVPENPLEVRGYICGGGLMPGDAQRAKAARVQQLQTSMQMATGACYEKYAQRIAVLRATCGTAAEVGQLEQNQYECIIDALRSYQPDIEKAVRDVDSSCELLVPPPLPPPVTQQPSETTPTEVDSQQPLDQEPENVLQEPEPSPAPPKKQAKVVVGGIILLVAAAVGYAGYRAFKKGKR